MASHQGLRTGLDPFEQLQSLFPGDCSIKKLGKRKEKKREETSKNLILLPLFNLHLKVQARETLPFYYFCFQGFLFACWCSVFFCPVLFLHSILLDFLLPLFNLDLRDPYDNKEFKKTHKW